MMNPEKSKVVAKKFHPSKVSISGEWDVLDPFEKKHWDLHDLICFRNGF